MGKTFTVTVPKIYEFEEGWGVGFDQILGENDLIQDITPVVVLIEEGRVKIVGNVPCVRNAEDQMWYPIENFKRREDLTVDDTHDLRDRFFDTLDEAGAHVMRTLKRWRNPQPWESFIET